MNNNTALTFSSNKKLLDKTSNCVPEIHEYLDFENIKL